MQGRSDQEKMRDIATKVLKAMHFEFCQNSSMSFPHNLMRCHRYSIKTLLVAATEETEIGSSVEVLKLVGALWACCKGI